MTFFAKFQKFAGPRVFGFLVRFSEVRVLMFHCAILMYCPFCDGDSIGFLVCDFSCLVICKSVLLLSGTLPHPDGLQLESFQKYACFEYERVSFEQCYRVDSIILDIKERISRVNK